MSHISALLMFAGKQGTCISVPMPVHVEVRKWLRGGEMALYKHFIVKLLSSFVV